MIQSLSYQMLIKGLSQLYKNLSLVQHKRGVKYTSYVMCLVKVPKKNSKTFGESLKAIFRYTDIELRGTAKNELIHAYSNKKRFKNSWQNLVEGFENIFQYTVVGKDQPRLKSTNVLERLNQEIRRREKVVRIFPNTDSAIRLIGAILIDIHEEWIGSSRKYIKI